MNIDDSGSQNSRSGNVAIQSRNTTRAGSGQLPAGLYPPVVSRRNFLPANQRRVFCVLPISLSFSCPRRARFLKSPETEIQVELAFYMRNGIQRSYRGLKRLPGARCKDPSQIFATSPRAALEPTAAHPFGNSQAPGP